jgi:hypothetical protein
MNVSGVDVGFVSNSEALVDFYVGALQVERLEPRRFPFATVHRLACGPVTLKVMVPAERATSPAPAQPFWAAAGLRYVTLWVDDLDDLARRWTELGGAVDMPVTEIRPGVRTAVLVDPDGNTVEAMQQS